MGGGREQAGRRRAPGESRVMEAGVAGPSCLKRQRRTLNQACCARCARLSRKRQRKPHSGVLRTRCALLPQVLENIGRQQLADILAEVLPAVQVRFLSRPLNSTFRATKLWREGQARPDVRCLWPCGLKAKRRTPAPLASRGRSARFRVLDLNAPRAWVPVQAALCDEDAGVREAAGAAFSIMFKGGAGSAVEGVVPGMLEGAPDPLEMNESPSSASQPKPYSPYAQPSCAGLAVPSKHAESVEGLRVILGVRPQMVNSVLPKLVKQPLAVSAAWHRSLWTIRAVFVAMQRCCRRAPDPPSALLSGTARAATVWSRCDACHVSPALLCRTPQPHQLQAPQTTFSALPGI